jgi:chromosome segregation protein
MYLKSLELIGFKSFGKKSTLEFTTPITAIVGPNGSGKSNSAEAFCFVLGEQSMKSLRGKRGEDLIWGGSTEVSRSNRASVKAVFDNTIKNGKRLLDIDYDEVEIERVVYRDGANEYLINGSKVRLKDVLTMLAGANIGYSGHHIISQGEADRVISASPRERRAMIEDALGLRVYQYKKEESSKKLEKTEENRSQVEALRKENAPHLRFLERQVKKLEKARNLREELVGLYHEYLKREEEYLSYEKETIEGQREEPEQALQEVTLRIESIRKTLEKTKGDNKESKELLERERELSQTREEKTNRSREVGRIEGQIVFEERRLEEEKKKITQEEGKPIPYSEAKVFWEEVTRDIPDDFETHDASSLVHIVKKIKKVVQRFVEKHALKEETYVPDIKTLESLQKEKEAIEQDVYALEEKITAQEEGIRALSAEIEKEKDDNRDLERELFSLMTKESTLRATLHELNVRAQALERDTNEFKREISEGVALIGRDVQGYTDYELSERAIEQDEDRDAQVERKRKLEKTKIRLEEIGGGSADEIMREYAEVKERDEFLGNELKDLEQSEALLKKLITELDQELSEKFKEGLAHISEQFNEFFVLMFDGGSASLSEVKGKPKRKESVFEDTEDEALQEEDEEIKSGVDIQVSLPKKRIQSLMMLSGGERALTSIALIFAMSQVNPPPFLILDETDAALDEANSRRYGDMIRSLSEKSQLILITHNRETMSRAHVLYGITMGADGISRILSVKFDDAVAVAK